MSEEETVCSLHKKQATAIICGHLCAMENGEIPDDNIGFNVPADIENDLEAWCDKCDKILNEEGSWNDRAVTFADLRPCCVGCFIVIKKRMGF